MITARQSAGLATSSGIAAVSTLLISVIAARSTSDEAAFKEFTVFWSLFFGAIGVITGIQQEATRATTRPERRTGARVMTVGAMVGVIGTVVMAAVVAIGHSRLLPLTGTATLIALAATVTVMALYQTFLGCAAGHRRWWDVTALISTDAIVRVGLVIAAALVLGALAGLQWAVLLASLSWVPFLAVSGFRSVFASRGDASVGTLLRNSGWTVLSAAALAALTTGFAAVLQVASPSVDARRLAVVMTVVTVTRSALLLPLQAFQGVVLARFSDASATALPREVRRLIVIVGALGLAAAVPAWLIGSPAIAWLFGAVYRPTPALVTGLWLAAIPLGWLVLTGQAALAQSLHRVYAAGWVTAALVTIGTLALPVPVEVKVVLALAAGPVIGASVHLAPFSRRRRAGAAPPSHSGMPR